MKDNFRGKAAEKKKFDLHYSNLVRQLMLRAEADRLRNNFAAYKKSREEVHFTELRPNKVIRHHK